MKVLLFGKNGQLGWELQRSLATVGELVALDRNSTELGLGCGDLAQSDAIRAAVRLLRPEVIVNAGAYTAVDKAEAERELACAVNTHAPAALAEAACDVGALLVHYSTDYVFDGSGDNPWSEDDATGPLNVYGQTKLDGEAAIRRSGVRHLIFRTSWVYASRGGNFARTMLRLAQERERLTVIDDQWGAPTGADLIADVTAHAVRHALRDPACAGTYHLASCGETNWHGYARFVLAEALTLRPGLAFMAKSVDPVATSDFQTQARRPLNSRLNTRRLKNTFDIALPHWQAGVRRMLAEIL